MYCSSCGTELVSEAVICPKCGSPTPKFKQNNSDITTNIIVASYIVGGLIPVIGWIMAIYLLVKGKIGHAIGVGALSICMAFIWIGLSGNL